MNLYTQTTGSCDAACPHPPYNQGSKLCRACPLLETQRTSVRLRSQVGTRTPAMRFAHACTHIPHTRALVTHNTQNLCALIRKVLYAHGVVKEDVYVEKNALELKGQYVGQTSPLVR